MGFFGSTGGGRKQTIEDQLVEAYAPIVQATHSCSLRDARQTIQDLIGKAREEAVAEGMFDLPVNTGDLLLEKEKTDPATKDRLDSIRKEGVRDQDIRNWWNRHELQRRLDVKLDEIPRIAMFINRRRNGETAEIAASAVKKVFAIYGHMASDESVGEDGPLPLELKERIGAYSIRRSKANRKEFYDELERASSFNAHIRQKLREGQV